jgi:hypothetical protein
MSHFDRFHDRHLRKPDLAEFGGRIIQDEAHGQFVGGNVGHYHDWHLIGVVASHLARATAVQIDRQPKRGRKPSLVARVNAVRKAGAKAGKISPDGTVSFTFDEPANNHADETNPWDTVLSDAADKKRPT